ncbi:cell division protein FtsQ/DivIB [Hippea maritima]|uniref:Polypeptide-transport-associated domain protein FtsQ-type n=1 Tax=Hippea maritima (strain ATCC 700847 / DSM 10411 / MH2) TaxID=760142 RepID=F2LW08_HIPMA|nr:FtsQ-type POTRA domain-containing protein [Hippea maritima]AEA33942.1 Polypeptide-transport-associated domain protein FtsQ-type [Hippea maritima DSM 10411]
MLDYKDLKKDEKPKQKNVSFKYIVNIAKLVVSLSIIAGFFILAAYAYNQYSSKYAKLRYVVIDGNRALPKTLISHIATKGSSLKLSSYKENIIYYNLISNPWIENARISKIYPDTLYIKVKEKSPSAAVILKKTAYIIDKNGSIIDTYKQYLRLPKLIKISTPNKAFLNNKTLLKAVMVMYEKLDKVEKINYIEIVSNSYQLAHFKGGLNVAVNSFDCPEKAITRLKEKWNYLYSLKNKLDSVSICFDNKFVLRWKKGVKR